MEAFLFFSFGYYYHSHLLFLCFFFSIHSSLTHVIADANSPWLAAAVLDMSAGREDSALNALNIENDLED